MLKMASSLLGKAPCSFVEVCRRFRVAYCLSSALKRLLLRNHSTVSQKAVIFILAAARTWNLKTRCIVFWWTVRSFCCGKVIRIRQSLTECATSDTQTWRAERRGVVRVTSRSWCGLLGVCTCILFLGVISWPGTLRSSINKRYLLF
jgi:hypothetical protein